MSIGKMTLGERIRHVRWMSGDLTMEQFAKRIGLTPSAISQFENGKANPSEQTLRSICREFNISEEWLKFGVGDVAPPTYESELEKLVKERGLTTADYIAIRNYMALPQRVRDVITFFMEHFVKDLHEFGVSDGSAPPKGSKEAAAQLKAEQERYARVYEMILNAGEKRQNQGRVGFARTTHDKRGQMPRNVHDVPTREQEAERVGEDIKDAIRNGGEKASESGNPPAGAGIA